MCAPPRAQTASCRLECDGRSGPPGTDFGSRKSVFKKPPWGQTRELYGESGDWSPVTKAERRSRAAQRGAASSLQGSSDAAETRRINSAPAPFVSPTTFTVSNHIVCSNCCGGHVAGVRTS